MATIYAMFVENTMENQEDLIPFSAEFVLWMFA